MSTKCPLLKTASIFDVDSNLSKLFRFNQFAEDIEFLKSPIWDDTIKCGKRLEDMDITRLRYYLGKIHDFEPSKQIVGEACFIISQSNRYHPVKNYIESVEWDGVLRLEEWLIKSCKCNDDRYIRDVSYKFMVASVSRVYNPGCKFDHMIILEGSQGIGKSTLVEIIAGDWYLDTNFGQRDKDLIDSLSGAMIVEISELSGFNKKDVDFLKSFLSRKTDRIRLPYAQRNQDFKRKCVFIGTYNPSGNNMYLRDDTGNRRFWPVECPGKIDFEWLRLNRSQLWAEALVQYNNHEHILYIDNPESKIILDNLHSERELESPTQKTISNYLKGKIEISMSDLIQDCLKIRMEGRSPKDLLSISTTIGIIMRKLLWTKGMNEHRDMYYAPGNFGIEKYVSEIKIDDENNGWA